jgi:hypothetical protein
MVKNNYTCWKENRSWARVCSCYNKLKSSSPSPRYFLLIFFLKSEKRKAVKREYIYEYYPICVEGALYMGPKFTWQGWVHKVTLLWRGFSSLKYIYTHTHTHTYIYMAPLCLMWCLWKERNAHSFEVCEIGSLNLKKLVIQTLFTWRVTLHSMSDCSFSDFLDLCFLFSLV